MDNGRAGQVTIVDSELTGVNASIEVSSEAEIAFQLDHF